jgi:MFS transporter, DHA2 family, multidrug resistance protein
LNSPPESHAALSPRQLFWAWLATYIALGLTSLEMYLANVALPVIATDLRVSEADVIWVVNVYQIAVVATLLPLAALGEIVGHQRVVIAGILVFTLGSLTAAFSPSLSVLLVGRGLQGLGASAIVSVNGALLTYIFPPNRLGGALSLNPLIVSVTMTLAPTIASLILAVGTWPWLFALTAVIGVLILMLSIVTLPKTPHATHGFDFFSAMLSGVAVGLIVLGISMAARAAHVAVIVGCLVAGVLLGWWLVVRQKDHPAPILPVDLFRIPAFSLSTAVALAAYCAQGLAFVPLPFFFQDVMGRSAVETGLMITPWPLLLAIVSPIAGRLADRYSAGLLGSVGLAILVFGFASLTTLHAQSTTWDVTWRLALCGFGFGFFQSPNLKTMILSAPRSRSGSASGMVGTARIIGQALGAALAALCYVVASGAAAAALAFWLGAGMALLGVAMSLLRLWVKQPGEG